MADYQCPECCSEELDVVIKSWARLIQGRDGDFETLTDECEDNHQEWGSASMMRCRDCGYKGIVNGFIAPPAVVVIAAAEECDIPF